MDLTPITKHVIPFVRTLVPLLRSQAEKDARQARSSNSVEFLTADGVDGAAERSAASLVKTAVKLGEGPMANALLKHAAAKAEKQGESFDTIVAAVRKHYAHKDLGNRVALGTCGGALVGSLVALGMFAPAAAGPLIVLGLAGVAAVKTRHATERLTALERLSAGATGAKPQGVLYTDEENDPQKPNILIAAQKLDDAGDAMRWEGQPEKALRHYNQALSLLQDVPTLGSPWTTSLRNGEVEGASDVWHADAYNAIGLLKHHMAKAYAQLRDQAAEAATKHAPDSDEQRFAHEQAAAAHEKFVILEGEAVRGFKDLLDNHANLLAPLTHTAALYNLACGESLLGEVNEARTHWDACVAKTLANLEAFPENKSIRKDAEGTQTALIEDDDLDNLKKQLEAENVPLDNPQIAAKLAGSQQSEVVLEPAAQTPA